MDRLRRLCLLLCILAALPGVAASAADEARAPGAQPLRVFMVLHRDGARADLGFRDYLESTGLDIVFEQRNIENDPERLPEVLAAIRAWKPDLIYAQRTLVTRGIVGEYGTIDPARHVTDTPVVFAMVSQPVQSRLVAPPQGDGPILSGRNLTGAVHVASEEVQLNAMLAFMPIRRLGVVTTLSERTQRERVQRLEELTRARGIELVAMHPDGPDGEPQPELIEPMMARMAAAAPDIVYIPPVTFFSEHSQLLTGAALRNGLPTFCAIEEQIMAQGLVGLVAPFYNVGQLAGYKAEQILRDGRPPGEIEIEPLSRFTYVVNIRTAHALGLYPPIKMLRYARVIDPSR